MYKRDVQLSERTAWIHLIQYPPGITPRKISSVWSKALTPANWYHKDTNGARNSPQPE